MYYGRKTTLTQTADELIILSDVEKPLYGEIINFSGNRQDDKKMEL